MRNTIEQYAGLISSAASPFFGRTFSVFRKSRNRTFSAFEQYAGLESLNGRKPAIQAARSRGSEPWIRDRIQGYQGHPGMPKAAKWPFWPLCSFRVKVARRVG